MTKTTKKKRKPQCGHDALKPQFNFSAFMEVWVKNGNKDNHHPAKILGAPFCIPISVFSQEKEKRILVESYFSEGMGLLKSLNYLCCNDRVWVVPILWTQCRRKDIVECFRIVGPIIIDEGNNVVTRRITRLSKAVRKSSEGKMNFSQDTGGETQSNRSPQLIIKVKDENVLMTSSCRVPIDDYIVGNDGPYRDQQVKNQAKEKNIECMSRSLHGTMVQSCYAPPKRIHSSMADGSLVSHVSFATQEIKKKTKYDANKRSTENEGKKATFLSTTLIYSCCSIVSAGSSTSPLNSIEDEIIDSSDNESDLDEYDDIFQMNADGLVVSQV